MFGNCKPGEKITWAYSQQGLGTHFGNWKPRKR